MVSYLVQEAKFQCFYILVHFCLPRPETNFPPTRNGNIDAKWCKYIGNNSATPSPKHFQLPVKSQLDFGVQSELLAGSILPLKNYNFLLNYELFPLESPCSQLNQVEPHSFPQKNPKNPYKNSWMFFPKKKPTIFPLAAPVTCRPQGRRRWLFLSSAPWPGSMTSHRATHRYPEPKNAGCRDPGHR